VPGAQDITSLHDLQPGDVFGQMYARAFSGEPPADLRAAFDELHDAVRREEVLA